MECLVLVHDASFSFVVDLAASITGYRVQASDIAKHEEKGPFIFAVQRERVVQSGERSPRLQGLWPTSLVINVASLDSVIRTEPNLHLEYHHEYLFWPTKFSCKGFSRFLTLVTGQSDPLAQIKSKQRSAYIGLTYPDIRVSLSNMPIVSVGADALELRVDLLREEDQLGDIPTLGYVAEQLVALRLQSELPIIFTIRLEPSGGRWPLEQKDLAIKYLRYGLLWGVDFIDVEDLLDNDLRNLLVSQKGHTKVIASHHDFSGSLDWSSSDTDQVYNTCASYGDMVLMAGISTNLSDASKIRQFRDRMNSLDGNKPLAAFNTGTSGKLSRILNPFLQATTHHLLPSSSARDQLSLVESNGVLSVLGELSPTTAYFSQGQHPDASLMDKCFKELNLPHRVAVTGQKPDTLIQSLLKEPDTASVVFGQFSDFSHLATQGFDLTDSGLVDTVVVGDGQMIGHNCQANGLNAVLLQENTPSAFADREFLVMSNSWDEARTVISVLLSLNCGKVWTLGFAAPNISDKLSSLNIKVLSNSFNPAGVFCMSPSHDRTILAALVTMIAGRQNKRRVIYLDTWGSPKDPGMTAAKASGWRIITQEHISAAVLVEMMRVSVDQSVPYSFVQMVKRQQLS
ncbi:hypothetical protein NCS57_01454700 [Fusarium keratoplasticum]|uniref:Uncharacterized protein n=1 Tax=Fusarium keratoplasticum TaxID=1328300 RepID=A0ACC0QCW4_9HYPO|nr:hypothetical protein NCS57_01454700 [Fusarium keratoplasticum]KAI8649185.1 hypothetical protein NCS57_01454700 [Fusarium keratoplasticum]